ncbi:hypothetical protein GCM10009096_01890 [Parasphingorhabdus litoris]|uniref:Uncharacterized protein n=1 Tax=Parasphingorhabdus litoris TaxID=394733 RepID=A0ABN1A120_9SPHN
MLATAPESPSTYFARYGVLARDTAAAISVSATNQNIARRAWLDFNTPTLARKPPAGAGSVVPGCDRRAPKKVTSKVATIIMQPKVSAITL